jgi:uncharacterized protein YecE (DUF72 family)
VRVWIGTSGYSYREWKGRFYPKALRASEMLRFYAQRFCAVEINNSFYRLPESETLRNWREQAGPGFAFALKAPGALTHQQRLRRSARSLAAFLRRAMLLGDQLGPVLFQLPPNFKKDVVRLRNFVRLVPSRVRAAFEFRHPSWFDDEVYDTLRAVKVALCIAEDEALSTPWVTTARFGYLRLRRPRYKPADLRAWAHRVTGAPWREAFVFFKHEDEARGPVFARRFRELLAPDD